MSKISDVGKMSINDKNQIFYEGKKIGKLGSGKTLFYFNPKNKTLESHNFSRLGLLFHSCGYKKKFNQEGLSDWLVSENSSITALTEKSKTTEKVSSVEGKTKAAKASKAEKLRFEKLLLTHSNSEEIIQLFKDGMSVNTLLHEESNYTVLHEACNRGRFEVAKYLIEHGANVNAMSKNSGYGSSTPLQFAMLVGYDKLTLLLLEKGADVNTSYSSRRTILHTAIDQLINKSRLYSPEQPEESNTKQIIQQLLAKGAKVNETDAEGATPLHSACKAGDLEVAKWLLDARANVNATDLSGRTPLHKACEKGDLGVVKWLLEDAGADIEIKYDGRTAAEIARVSFHEDIFDFLNSIKT